MNKIVLVADDSKTIRTAIEMTYGKNSGYEVISTSDGQAALLLAKEKKPALILTDHKLPGLDGYDLLAALKQDSATSSVPVVVMTSQAKPFDKVRGVGADANIVKPFLSQELIDLTEKVIKSGAKASAQEEFEIFIDAEPPDDVEEEEFPLDFPGIGYKSDKPTAPVMPAFTPSSIPVASKDVTSAPKPTVPTAPVAPKTSIPVAPATPMAPVAPAAPKPSVPVAPALQAAPSAPAAPKPSIPVAPSAPSVAPAAPKPSIPVAPAAPSGVPVAPKSSIPVAPSAPSVAPAAPKPSIPIAPAASSGVPVAPKPSIPVAPAPLAPAAPKPSIPVAPSAPSVAPAAPKPSIPVAPSAPVAPKPSIPVAPSAPVAPKPSIPVAPMSPAVSSAMSSASDSFEIEVEDRDDKTPVFPAGVPVPPIERKASSGQVPVVSSSVLKRKAPTGEVQAVPVTEPVKPTGKPSAGHTVFLSSYAPPVAPDATESKPASEVSAVTSAETVNRIVAASVEKVQAATAESPEYLALTKLSREIIEKIAWEVVPQLAEVIIKEVLAKDKKLK